MKSLIFDIETDGITDVSVIWCISAVDLDSSAVYEFGPDQIDEGVKLLQQADKLIGHNIINYDIPWIKKNVALICPIKSLLILLSYQDCSTQYVKVDTASSSGERR